MTLKRRSTPTKTKKLSKSEKLKKASKSITSKGKKKKKKKYTIKDLFPTGSTLLNLACSGCSLGGYAKGKLVNLIGDSSTGKTFLALTGLAECANREDFDDFDLYLDDVENALEFDMETLFGSKAAKRIKSPYPPDEDGEPVASETVEDFYLKIYGMLKEVEKGERKPFLYILDSLDALTARETQDIADKAEKKHDTSELSKSYKTGKPRVMSEMLSSIKGKLRRTKCGLIIISQTRDNLGFGFSTKTRSGGRALKFYCTHEIWLSVKKTFYKKINDVNMEIGGQIIAKISKNKLNGWKRIVEFPIYYDYGVDDITSMVEFLVQHKAISKSKNTLSWRGVSGVKENLIRQIEKSKSLKIALRKDTANKYLQIEESLKLNRAPRFK